MSGSTQARGRPIRQIVCGLLLLGLFALLLSGCETETAQNTFAAEGDVARTQRDIFYYAMWPAIAIMIGVEGMIVVMLLRFRRREGDAIPKQTHGNMPLEITWTILPAVLLLVLGIPMVFAIFDIGREPKANAYPIDVTGTRFTWEFGYPELGLDEEGKPLVVTFGELHIPAAREIGITLRSIDVIHSFAVPRIAGTRDAIPGEENRMWIKADKPAAYAGQCREFCGLDHALMKITLIVQSQEDFDAWADEMRAGVKKTADGGADGAVSAEAEGE